MTDQLTDAEILRRRLRQLATEVGNYEASDARCQEIKDRIAELNKELVSMVEGDIEETAERGAAEVAAERRREDKKLERFQERVSAESLREKFQEASDRLEALLNGEAFDNGEDEDEDESESESESESEDDSNDE